MKRLLLAPFLIILLSGCIKPNVVKLDCSITKYKQEGKDNYYQLYIWPIEFKFTLNKRNNSVNAYKVFTEESWDLEVIVFNDELIKGIHTYEGNALNSTDIFTINMTNLEIKQETQTLRKTGYGSDDIVFANGQCKKV